MLLRCIPNDENIKSWVELPAHTNVVTAFDSFVHDNRQFQLTEYTNGGNMYQYIEGLNLNLALQVPSFFLEIVYDCIIQLAMAMEYAHSNQLVHGTFDLSHVVLSKDGDNVIYKMNNFKP